MNNDVEHYIRQNIPWSKLPTNIKQSLGNVQKEYEKMVVSYSIKNQLRYRGNIVRQIRKETGEQRYYEEMLQYSQTNLLLYPYHLSDVVVKGLRVTPFQYYTGILKSIMEQERSYDSLPNFTAADCLRLLGIGRNEYIELMNQCRSGQKLFRRKNIKDLLPSQPIDIALEPWWVVDVGCVTEADIRLVSPNEKEVVDKIIDNGRQRAGELDHSVLLSIYKKGLVYLQLPIEDSDRIVVPPLEGFVMNRVSGDSFETLLYKIFVSTDEHTSVGELANVLRTDTQSVKNAVSLYCRLGFAKKKLQDSENQIWHPSWRSPTRARKCLSPSTDEPLLLELNEALAETANIVGGGRTGAPLQRDELPTPSSEAGADSVSLGGGNETEEQAKSKRTAFLFDSTLTAFLMMGNLSPGLKSHAVTMFEVGKLSDELIDSFLCELEKVSTTRDDSEGEVRRYFEHALILRSTVMRLRHVNSGLDLIRCESLQSLDNDTCTRLLKKNYGLLVTMAPLSKEVRPIIGHRPPHLGPPTPEVNSIWFKLFLYDATGSGPPSILLTRGTRIRKLPRLLRSYEKVLVTLWGHDPTLIPLANLVFALNDALVHSPVLIQAYGCDKAADCRMLSFPFPAEEEEEAGDDDTSKWRTHPAVKKVASVLDVEHSCGYLTMVRLKRTSFTAHRPGGLVAPLWDLSGRVGCRMESNDEKVRQFLDAAAATSVPDSSPQQSTSPSSTSDATWIHNPAGGSESPVNGITDKESAHILEEELDHLTETGVYRTGSRSSSPAPPGGAGERETLREVALKTTTTWNASEENGNGDRDAGRRGGKTSGATKSDPGEMSDWTLLDCSFGVPLFEADINGRICETIVKRLAEKDSLDRLAISNQKLGKSLEEFIVKYQDLNKHFVTRLVAPPHQKDVPWPGTNLVFWNGRLAEWDRK